MRLGRSKEEFLEINGPQMATATHVIVLLSDAAATSPFVFHEVLFADWLGKKIVTAMFKNSWYNLRPSMKAVLGNRSNNIIQLFSIHIHNVNVCIAVQTLPGFHLNIIVELSPFYGVLHGLKFNISNILNFQNSKLKT